MLRAMLVIFILVLAALPALAQDDESGWRFVSARRLSDLIEGDYTFENPVLSPDGSAIWWDEVAREEWCFYTFADENVRCVLREDEARFRIRRYNFPVWSPDGAELSATENFFMFLMDPDVWTLDVADGTFANRTDDNFYGGFLDSDRPDDTPVDYVPSYNPGDGLLYFFRSVQRDADPSYTLELWRLSSDGELERVRDFTSDLDAYLPIYRPVAWSPDGTQLAIIVLPQDYDEHPSTGVWVYDLEADTMEQIATFDDLRQAMPSWFEDPMIPEHVYWSSRGWVVHSSSLNTMTAPPVQSNVYLISHEGGKVVPLLDFSDVPDRVSMFNTTPGPLFEMPFTAIVSADGTRLWYLNFAPTAEEQGISEIDLTGDMEPRLLSTGDYRPGPRQEAPPSTSIDGKVLFYDVLVIFERE